MAKYQRFKVLHPSGELESLMVPKCFNAKELAEHYRHSVIILCVPKGHNVIMAGRARPTIMDGPCEVIYGRESGGFVVGWNNTQVDRLPESLLWNYNAA